VTHFEIWAASQISEVMTSLTELAEQRLGSHVAHPWNHGWGRQHCRTPLRKRVAIGRS